MRDFLKSAVTVRRLALASLIANIGIVITGGAVRLTGSGLGCPTWPSCTDRSYVATSAMGIHGAIEFSNRLLSFVLGVIALVGLLSALSQRPRRRQVTLAAALVLAGIPAQAVVGGITVLTDLNPWVVGCHFLVSIAVIAAAYWMWLSAREGDGPPRPTVPAALRHLVLTLVAVSGAVVVVGTIVTGSGPHAGDAQARRTGLDPEAISQAHADLVFLFLGLTVAAWFAFGAVGAARARQRTGWLFAIILAQGVIGFVQYFTNLPALLVGAHMAGACAVWVGTLAVWAATRTRDPLTAGPEPDAADDRVAQPAQPRRVSAAKP